MRYPFKNYFYLIVLPSFFIVISSCTTNEPLVSESMELDQSYTTLSNAITERDIDLLWELKENSDNWISGAAWRALAITKFDDLRNLMDLAIDTDQEEAWYVLRFQDLTEMDKEELSTHFFTSDANRGPICSFFYSQGDRWTLDMLLKYNDLILEQRECAMAVGGMLSRIEAGEENINRVIELVNELDDSDLQSFLLYGLWRSPLNRPDINSEAIEKLFLVLEKRKDSPPALIDEFLIRLTEGRGFDFVMINRSDDELSNHIQLSVELARTVRFLNGGDLDKNTIDRLLNHPNPHVTVMTLESLKELDNLDHNWMTGLSKSMNHYPENAEVAITYLELLQMNGVEILEMNSMIDQIDQIHPYLKNRTLGLYRVRSDSESYLELLLDTLGKEGIEALHATVALSELANSYNLPPVIRDRIRDVITTAILNQNRPVITSSGQLLTNRYYFNEDDKQLFMEGYDLAVDRQNYSVAQLLMGVMNELSLIDENFNPETGRNEFQMPDWQRLFEIGDHPQWVLKTNRGDIVIQLDPETAPFTVSSIDSLTRAGMYDGVNFHRVVRNFVIQGGDFDRRDGLGGPGYRIPTEPALYTFERGKVGMASSGQDTEGSQFFITHTWTPHLDGLYTIFGEVIQGMDIVDRIQIGDVVLSAEILR